MGFIDTIIEKGGKKRHKTVLCWAERSVARHNTGVYGFYKPLFPQKKNHINDCSYDKHL